MIQEIKNKLEDIKNIISSNIQKLEDVKTTVNILKSVKAKITKIKDVLNDAKKYHHIDATKEYNFASITDLEKYGKMFCKKYFDIDFKIPVLFNGRLKKCEARFTHKRNYKCSIKIEMAKRTYKEYNLKMIQKIFEHELIHYALYELGKDYKDGHKTFEYYLKLFNCPSNFFSYSEVKNWKKQFI